MANKLPEGFYEGAALANMNQLLQVIVDTESIAFHSAPRCESDYAFHLGGLEHSLENLELRIKKENRLIELKCEKQDITYDEAKAQLKTEFLNADRRYALHSHRIVNAMDRLESEALNPKEMALLKELYLNLNKKLNHVFIKNQTKGQKSMYLRARKAFFRQDLKELILLDTVAEDAELIYKDDVRKYAAFYGDLIYVYAKKIDKIRNSYPFTKMRGITSDQALKEKQGELQKKIKEKTAHLYSLEKTRASLYK